MVAAKCGLPKDLADSQPAAHLTINGPASVFAFLIPLRNTLCVMYLGAHLSVHMCVCVSKILPAEDKEGVHLWVHL